MVVLARLETRLFLSMRMVGFYEKLGVEMEVLGDFEVSKPLSDMAMGHKTVFWRAYSWRAIVFNSENEDAS